MQIETGYGNLGDIMVDVGSALCFASCFLLCRNFHVNWRHFDTYPTVSIMHVAFLGKLAVPFASHAPDKLAIIGHHECFLVCSYLTRMPIFLHHQSIQIFQ